MKIPKRLQGIWGQILAVFLLGMATDFVWHVVTGHRPAWWEQGLVTFGAIVVWDAVQRFRLSRAFWDLVMTYELRPAFGEDPDEFWEDRG